MTDALFQMWLKLYDPARSPAHWLQIIRPGEHALFVLDAKSRTARDKDGRAFPQGEASVAIVPDLAAGIGLAEQIVNTHPELCCEIYDHAGKSGEPVRTVYHPSIRNKYEGLPLARRQTYIGLSTLALAMIFVIYDARHDLRWMWGYIVGLKLTVIGGSFLIRGVAGILECRADGRRPGT